MKVADYIAYFLEKQGVPCVFEMSGGMITHLLDSIFRRGKVRLVAMHHEQAAAFAAEAFGRMTGMPGVALATSGPGATNLLTGIGSCYFDSSPAVFITGQVNRDELKGERRIRQLGFQETDIVSLARPITKAAWMVQTPEEVPELLQQAFVIASNGRSGPVLLDIPMDVQRSDIPTQMVKNVTTSIADNLVSDQSLWEDFFMQLSKAKRPLILAGGGIRSGGATELFRNFVQKLRIPVVNSLMGVDVLPYSNPLRVGMIGTYGNRWANLSIDTSDFLLVLGSRLDVRQTGPDTKPFTGDRVIYHVDCEPGEINNRVTGCREIVMDLRKFLASAIHIIDDRKFNFKERREWRIEIENLRRSWPDRRELFNVSGINPNSFMHQLSAVSAQASCFLIDVGQHQMWAAQSLELGTEQRFLTSGGMGSMGFALPAAIGVVLSNDSRPVVVIAGDGGFQCNIQELQTIVRNHLPIKIVIMNNGCLGMVRQFQESYFEGRYVSTLWGYSAPDFTRVASAYGIPGRTVKDKGGVEEALDWLWQAPDKPALLQVMVPTNANAYPKVAFGRPLSDMEPFATLIGTEGT